MPKGPSPVTIALHVEQTEKIPTGAPHAADARAVVAARAGDGAHAFAKSHLALVALRPGHSNADLVSELTRTLYLTFFANEAGTPNAPFDTFLAAELALKACIHQAVTADEWRLEAAQCEVIEAVLRAYDAQLTSLPAHKIEAATVRLGRMLERGSFPDLAATQESALGRSGGEAQTT
jgi:hypothetical protein